MHVSSRRVAPIVTVAMALAAPATADLFRVGVGSGCTHATVQEAVDAAALTAETDTVLIARNTTYNGQAITIHDQSLNLFGGYADCNTFVPSGRTVLSGAGGAAAPVLSVTGSGNVSLWRIDLTRGDTADTAQGGGLYFNGSGVMRLEDLSVINNDAGYGAGIHARGTSATAELLIGPNVLVSNNTAARNGGGIHADKVRLTMTSPGSAVFFNTAVGLEVNGQMLWGDGGGIQCVDCQARIGSASAVGTIFLNVANNRGGGIGVDADDRDILVELFTGTAASPLAIWGNRAGVSGGGIYAQSDHSTTGSSHDVVVQSWDVVLRENLAPEGAAVFVRGSNGLAGLSTASFTLGKGSRPPDAVPCAPDLRPCNRISANESRTLDDSPANGAILQGATWPFFELVHAWIADNVGRAVLRQTTFYSVFRGCVLTGNTVTEELIQHLDVPASYLNHTTIAGNAIGGAHVVRSGGHVSLAHGIVWQPGRLVLRRDSSEGDVVIRNMLVHDIEGLPPQVDIVAPPSPGFASLVERDFRLRGDSMAVDFAEYASGFEVLDLSTDLDGGARQVDLAEVENEFGPRDLGAYELQEFPDLIFKDGFDLGGLAGWSSTATDGGDLSATPAAALVGTQGLRALVDDTAGLFVQDDSPNDERRYRARFYLDPNGFDPGEALGHRRTRVFIAFSEGPLRRVMAVVLRRLNGAYALMARARLDDNQQADTGFVPVGDAPHVVEVDLQTATGPDTNDGGLGFWVDGVLVASVSGLDNHLAAVDMARLGALSVKGGSSGALRFDAFESRRGTYIGPEP